MEDKKKMENKQMLEIAERETWIKTPFSYVKLGNKLTLLQQDAMLMVSGHIQSYIKRFFDLNLHKSKEKPRSLFANHLLHDGIPGFKIYLAEMGINTANYKVVREAIEEMNLLVEKPETDKNGKPTGATEFVPVFKRFRVPQTGDYYRKTNDQGEVIVESARHSGYIEVEINNEVAMWAFDMASGYATHPKLIARYATKRSTPRLYFKLQELMGIKKSTTVRCTVQEIKDYLGFETYKDDQTGEWIVPYAKFAHFKSKVLDAVKADMDRMAEEDHADITFDYQPIYLNGRKRGDPDFIEFKIKSTKLGMAYNLLTGVDTPATEEERERMKKQAVQQELFTDEYQQRWQQCQEEILMVVDDDDGKRVFTALRYESWDDKKKMLILQTTERGYDWLEQKGDLRMFKKYLNKYFGKDMKLSYRVIKPTS